MLAGLLFPHMETSDADGARVRGEAKKESKHVKKSSHSLRLVPCDTYELIFF